MVNIIVAIDGPTGTGKSTTARLLADKLGLKYIDSGAMYRIVTYELLRNHIKPNEIRRIVDIAKRLNIEFECEDVRLNGEIINNEIRSFEVTNKVSSVSKIRQIREIIVAKQREYAKNCGVVMDGRDIGTVVFPSADFKFFLICDLNTRAARRQQDFLDLGIKIPIDKIITEIQKRDEMDTTRKISPLIMAQDATEVDTTNMIIEEQVDFLYRKIISSPDYK
jgi:cytidylate kinase